MIHTQVYGFFSDMLTRPGKGGKRILPKWEKQHSNSQNQRTGIYIFVERAEGLEV